MGTHVKSKQKQLSSRKTQKFSPSPVKTKSLRIFDDDSVSALDELAIFHHVMDFTRDEILIVREDSRIVYLNDTAVEGFGYSKKYLLSKKLFQFFEGRITQAQWKRRYLGEVAKSKNPPVFLINRIGRWKKLSTLEISIAGFQFQLDKYYVVIGKNITHRMELIKKMRESENFYRQVCEQSTDAICTLSLDGKVIYANKAAEEMVKTKLSKTRSTHFSKYIESESVSVINKIFTKTKAGEGVAFERARIVDKTGKIITIEITSFPVYKAGKVFQIHCIFRDIGKRLQVENILLESQKMKAVQLFIAGTSHEIQNPLNGLLTRAQILIDRYGDRSFEYIGYNEFKNIIQTLITMRDQIKYCCDINNRLMDISKRKVKMQKAFCDVNAVISETVKMFEHELKFFDIHLKVRLGKDLPPVAMSRIDFNQVFVNIFTNALQSMLGGTDVTVRTKYLKKEKKVQIDCQDQGIGISKDILPRVFEPFFTTKQRGLKKNAGLGLSIVYSIVKAAKGNIRIISNERKGTTVQLYLPV